MKRQKLLRKIAQEAKRQQKPWLLARHGANHDIWNLDGLMVPIARHTEFGERYSQMVCKECEAVLGKGWWR